MLYRCYLTNINDIQDCKGETDNILESFPHFCNFNCYIIVCSTDNSSNVIILNSKVDVAPVIVIVPASSLENEYWGVLSVDVVGFPLLFVGC